MKQKDEQVTEACYALLTHLKHGITADSECSHEIKRHLLAPWKKSYDQPRQHIKKQIHYSANKLCLVKAMVFPVVTYGCESWTVKKVEH